ncbi:MAG: hypothetical protein ABW185_10520 [Sedimenticola sp.]
MGKIKRQRNKHTYNVNEDLKQLNSLVEDVRYMKKAKHVASAEIDKSSQGDTETPSNSELCGTTMEIDVSTDNANNIERTVRDKEEIFPQGQNGMGLENEPLPANTIIESYTDKISSNIHTSINQTPDVSDVDNDYKITKKHKHKKTKQKKHKKKRENDCDKASPLTRKVNGNDGKESEKGIDSEVMNNSPEMVKEKQGRCKKKKKQKKNGSTDLNSSNGNLTVTTKSTEIDTIMDNGKPIAITENNEQKTATNIEKQRNSEIHRKHKKRKRKLPDVDSELSMTVNVETNTENTNTGTTLSEGQGICRDTCEVNANTINGTDESNSEHDMKNNYLEMNRKHKASKRAKKKVMISQNCHPPVHFKLRLTKRSGMSLSL